MRHLSTLRLALALPVFVAALLVVLPQTAHSQAPSPPPTEAQLTAYLKATDIRGTFLASIEAGMKEQEGKLPPRLLALLWEEFRQDTILTVLEQEMRAFFRTRFTGAELAELTRWQESPLGQKSTRLALEQMNHMQGIGRTLGEAAGRRAVARYQAEQAATGGKDD